MEKLEYNISLERLKLESFRCFSELEINFEEKLTVFIAANGGGKTTILDAIAEGLKAYLAALKVKGYTHKIIPFEDIREGEKSARCEILTDVTFVYTDEHQNNNQLKQDESVVSFNITTNTRIEKEEDNAFFSKVEILKNYSKDELPNLPVLVYYGGNSVETNYKSKEKTSFERLDMVYNNSLSSERFDFTSFYNWYRDNDYKVKLEYNKTIDQQLTKIKTAIGTILNDDKDNPTYTNLRLNNKLKMGMSKKQPTGGTRFIEINQFSAGEKALFAFVADLGLRLLNATPINTTVEDDGIGVINGKGIVLIDEVDLHLHPEWQGKVVPKLMQIFPDIQWVMTTHSPAVLQNIPKGSARKLIDNRISTQELYTRGRDIESIYFDAFGQEEYPEEQRDLTDKVRHFYDIMDEGNEEQLEEAKEIIETLEQEWGSRDKKIIELKTLFELTYQ